MRIVRYILFVIALALLAASIKQFLKGYGDWEAAQAAEKAYQAEIQALEAQRDAMKHHVEMLKTDDLTQQRLARRRLGYIKPGETKYKIVRPSQNR